MELAKKNKEKWIIDSDPGCDDMMCLIYMLNRKDIEILMVSLVEGNTTIENVCKNMKKILKITQRLDVPIYQGGMPIIKGTSSAILAHQADGLGDIPDLIQMKTDDVEMSKECSVIKMIELIQNNPGELNLLMIGPLTNLALAYMLNPEIVNLLNKIFIMGGAINSKGNLLPASEFNFSYDYVATKIVLNNFKKIVMLPWESIENYRVNLDNFSKVKKALENIIHNEMALFYCEKLIHKYTELRNGIIICDLYCSMCIFNKEIVKNSFLARCDSILDTEIMRGNVIIKNKKKCKDYDDGLKELCQNNESGIQLVVGSLDVDLIMDEMRHLYIS
jgi:inosine-uridine nucleoside N-ribohydrolase